MKTPAIGTKFGRLTFNGGVSRINTGAYVYTAYTCTCDCGNVSEYRRGNLMSGHTTSCGCYALEIRTTHGMAGSPEYVVWDCMVQRATNPNASGSQYYFDKGVDIDPRWLTFENFYADMGPRPEGTSIERRKNDEGYWPRNCVWATSEVQANNTSRNRRVTFNGVEMNMVKACRAANISVTTVYKRLQMGLSMDDALTKPVDMRFSRIK